MGAQACQCAKGRWGGARTPIGNRPSRRRASHCTARPTLPVAPPECSEKRSSWRTSDRTTGDHWSVSYTHLRAPRD
eukprot:14317492-Alexandrium_andersonii.AAC.1